MQVRGREKTKTQAVRRWKGQHNKPAAQHRHHKLTHRMLSTWADLASQGESQAVVVLSKAHPPSASVMMELMIAAAAAGAAWPESE